LVRNYLLLNLRDFTKTLKIESLITNFLDEDCGVINPKFKIFHEMNKAGVFLIIFDGFDEMAVRVDSDTLELNLKEIEKLSIAANSKVIITSRIEYFINVEEEEKSLCPKREILPTREKEYEKIKILPWDDNQINSFLQKRVPLISEAKESWKCYRKRINDIEGLSDLSRRPVLLEMIVKTLPQLITSGIPINRCNLYETYLSGEIKRQKILKKRMLLLSDEIRFSILQKLAIDLYNGDINNISYKEAFKYIEYFVKPSRDDLEALTREFLTLSFLIRKSNNYFYSHRSIMEYLVAKFLFQEIKTNSPIAFIKKLLEAMIVDFLKEFNPDINILWDWIVSAKNKHIHDIKFLGGNAITLLCNIDPNYLIGKDLSGSFLAGANLSFLNLENIILKDTKFYHTIFVNSRFTEEGLKSARIYESTFSFTIIKYEQGKNYAKFKNVEDFLDKIITSVIERIPTKAGKVTHTIFSDKYLLIAFVVLVRDKNEGS